MLFFDFGWIFGLFLIFGGRPNFSFFPVPVPPVPVPCPVPPVPVPNPSVLRFPVRFASFLHFNRNCALFHRGIVFVDSL